MYISEYVSSDSNEYCGNVAKKKNIVLVTFHCNNHPTLVILIRNEKLYIEK